MAEELMSVGREVKSDPDELSEDIFSLSIS